MRYSRLENKTSRVKSFSREIPNTLSIREKGRTFESQNSGRIFNIH